MCLRAAGVMAITIFATGLSTNVWMIITLRFIQGIFSGYISNATALMAGETPHNRSGRVMTAMMTAGVTGNLIGPLLGGTLSGWFGYRIPFFYYRWLNVSCLHSNRHLSNGTFHANYEGHHETNARNY